MTVYPAIDLKAGRCVRLAQGDTARETVYGDDPAAVARRWVGEGAQALHVVDLDGAFAGRPVQLATVRAIAAAAGVPVQLGGGLRSLGDLEAAFAAGASRAVVGTRALDPDFLARAVARHGGRLVAALDARDGVVAVAGWRELSGVRVTEAALRLKEAGVNEVLYTDVAHDGMLDGPDLAGVAALVATGLRVIASGGVASAEDIRSLKAAGAAAAVVGKALYDGRLTLAAALEAAREAA